MKIWAAIAPEGYELELERELSWRSLKPLQRQGRLYLFEGKLEPLFWAQVRWIEAERIPFTSISDAVKKLRPKAKKFLHFSSGLHRRGELILEQLREAKEEIFEFPALIRPLECGAYTLLGQNEILFCKEFDRPHPFGEVKFVEDKAAPSRAYLKLWEGLSLSGEFPKPDELCLELGASPGGWTYVLAGLKSKVIAVDRAALDPKVLAMPGVQFQSGDAFQALPKKIGKVDWLCSDLICYPEKLWEFLEEWRSERAAKNFFCTLKFQGDANLDTVAKFAQHGRILHLFHNKHELTWISDLEQTKA